MSMRQQIIFELLQKTASVLSYALSKNNRLIGFLLGSIFSISSIVLLTLERYKFNLWDFPFFCVVIMSLLISFFILGFSYYLLDKKSYNKAHIYDLGKEDLRDFPLIWNKTHLIQIILLILLYNSKYENIYVYLISYFSSYLLFIIFYFDTNKKIKINQLKQEKLYMSQAKRI